MTDFENNAGRWYDVLLQRARAGKAFLQSEETPDGNWKLSNVNLSKLDQSSTSSCVAAQFYDMNYLHAISILDLSYEQRRDYGFIVGNETVSAIMDEEGWEAEEASRWAYKQLTLAWVQALCEVDN